MPSRVIHTPDQALGLGHMLAKLNLPMTVTWVKGKPRSINQNSTQRMWCNEIAEQLGDRTPEEVRGYIKLTAGVPILRAENEEFAAKYDEHVKGLPYETKLAIMMEPLDMPITRLMTTEQKTRFLDAVRMEFTAMGVMLTMPEER